MRISTGVLALALLATGAAEAKPKLTIKDQGKHERPMRLDFVAGASHVNAGGAVWFSFPVADDGFIPKLNDSFHVELGAYGDYFFPDDGYFGVTPAGGVKWAFHLTEKWTAYGTAKVAGTYGFKKGRGFGVNAGGGVGAYYAFSDGLHFRLDAGWPYFANAGISIPL